MAPVLCDKHILTDRATKYIRPALVSLDVGCGIRPALRLGDPSFVILLEPYAPYLDAVRAASNGYATSERLYIQATWQQFFPCLPDHTIDLVCALDLIEHLERADGERFLREAARVACGQVVIFAPIGLYSQTHDRLGMGGDAWQTHRSAWTLADFPDPWRVFYADAFHLDDEYDRPLARPVGAMYAILDVDA